MTKTSRFWLLLGSLVALTFVAGAAAGVIADRMFGPKVVLRTSLGDMSAVLDRLDLTAEQRRQADSIVARSTPRTEAIMLDVAERLRAVADSVDAELRAVLEPGQRAKLDSMRRDARVLLKRKTPTPGGTRVDTLLDTAARP
jgi:hypothetical protein